LSVLGDHSAKRGHILQGSTHQQRIADTPSVIGKHGHRSRTVCHAADVGELFPAKILGYRTDWTHLNVSSETTALGDKFDEFSRIRDGTCVGHCMDRRESPGRRGPRTRQDCLGTFSTGLPKVGMQVDESGKGYQSVRIDYTVC
jgi:hypothetical protein